MNFASAIASAEAVLRDFDLSDATRAEIKAQLPKLREAAREQQRANDRRAAEFFHQG